MAGTLKFVLKFQTITLLVALATLLLTVFLYIIIPKGFFPVQDTGVIQASRRRRRQSVQKEMAAKQQAMAQVIRGLIRRSRASRHLLARMEPIRRRTAAESRSI